MLILRSPGQPMAVRGRKRPPGVLRRAWGHAWRALKFVGRVLWKIIDTI